MNEETSVSTNTLFDAILRRRFVRRHNPGYGSEPGQAYRWHDGGMAMGNISHAHTALGRPGRWRLYEESDEDTPPHPEGLEPLGWLDLSA